MAPTLLSANGMRPLFSIDPGHTFIPSWDSSAIGTIELMAQGEVRERRAECFPLRACQLSSWFMPEWIERKRSVCCPIGIVGA